ncbi:MAG: LysM peptidoglycan-binding domain-containing protein [Anaerolineaceae bacterium]
MPKKYWLTLSILLLALLSLTACERAASTPPVSTPEIIDSLNTPLPVDQQIMSATMTAQAIRDKFNQPTQVVTNAQGTQVVATSASILQPTSTPVPNPTATPLPATPMVTKPLQHTVQAGETIYCLARRYDVDPSEMLALNNYVSWLSVGDVLDVPTSGSWPTEDRSQLPHPDTWTVSAGETIYSIACEYGDVYPEAIIAVNGLTEPYDLTAGQVLQIP